MKIDSRFQARICGHTTARSVESPPVVADEDRGKCQRCEAAKRRNRPRPGSHDGEQRHPKQPEESDRPDDAERRCLPLVLRDLCGVLRLLRCQGVDAMAVHR